MSKKAKSKVVRKAEESKSEIIRRHYDSGYSVKEIKEMTGCSDALVRIVIRNLNKKREKNSAKEGKARFNSPRSRLINDLFQVKKAMDAIEAKADVVNHPPHYTAGGVETLDFIEAKDLNYRLGNVVKYVVRCGKKANSDPVQDLEKAAFYLNREIAARKSA